MADIKLRLNHFYLFHCWLEFFSFGSVRVLHRVVYYAPLWLLYAECILCHISKWRLEEEGWWSGQTASSRFNSIHTSSACSIRARVDVQLQKFPTSVSLFVIKQQKGMPILYSGSTMVEPRKHVSEMSSGFICLFVWYFSSYGPGG